MLFDGLTFPLLLLGPVQYIWKDFLEELVVDKILRLDPAGSSNAEIVKGALPNTLCWWSIQLEILRPNPFLHRPVIHSAHDILMVIEELAKPLLLFASFELGVLVDPSSTPWCIYSYWPWTKGLNSTPSRFTVIAGSLLI